MDIVVIGSGNIATHLAVALNKNSDNNILQIYSHTLANAKTLANAINSEPINDLTNIDNKADIYIIAVSDIAIQSIVDQLPDDLTGLVIHTSGATSMDILSKFDKHGVVYPPQSINKNIETDMSLIPWGIESNSQKNYENLRHFWSQLSTKIFPCDSTQRLTLHLAAVFANNFTNALVQISYDLLQNKELEFDLIRPIILETANKLQTNIPTDTQTGPAVRNDYNTINKHLQLLSQQAEESKIYQLLTDFIIKRNTK